MDPSLTDLLAQGLELMLVGMTIVFAFLLLLVGMLFAMSWISARLAPEVAAESQGAARHQPPSAEAQDSNLVAVIGAAIHAYRSRHRR